MSQAPSFILQTRLKENSMARNVKQEKAALFVARQLPAKAAIRPAEGLCAAMRVPEGLCAARKIHEGLCAAKIK